MKTSDIMNIFGLSVYSDKELKTDEEILNLIRSCKKLTDAMRIETKKRYRKGEVIYADTTRGK